MPTLLTASIAHLRSYPVYYEFGSSTHVKSLHSCVHLQSQGWKQLRHVNCWASMACYSSYISELQVSERPCLRKQGGG